MADANVPPPDAGNLSLPSSETLGTSRLPIRWRAVFIGLGALLLIAFYTTSDVAAVSHSHTLSALDFWGATVCHRLADRSFVIAGRQLPLCARCSGMYLGVLLVFLMTVMTGRERWAALPRLPLLLALLGFVGVMGIDGLNSYSHFFPNFPHLYTPQNWLRLLTGMGAGLALGSIIAPTLAQTLWQAPQWQPSLQSWGELAGLILLSGSLVLLVLSNQPTILYVLALVSSAGLLLILSAINSMLLLIALRREGRCATWRQALPPLGAGLLLALAELSLGAWLRLSVFGTLTGLPGLS